VRLEYLPEATLHIRVTPAVLGTPVSQGILGVGKSLKHTTQALLFTKETLECGVSVHSDRAAEHPHPFNSTHEPQLCDLCWDSW
jgi:hypothetical protein